jgi:hypothetical protein
MRALNFGTIPDWGMLAVGIVTAALALRTLRNIMMQSEAAKDTATAALKEAESITAAERAYVKLSHLPPGMIFNNGYCGARIRVKNFGRTPARVTGVVMSILIRDLEDTSLPPPLTVAGNVTRPFRAFLVANDEFSFTESRHVGHEATEQLIQGLKRLFLFGYVDYIDQFGQRHRAGYARAYLSGLDDRKLYPSDEAFKERSNLDLLTEPKYNYDRPRKMGEGTDWIWDDPAI